MNALTQVDRFGPGFLGLLNMCGNLLLPRACAGCDRPDCVLCPSCAALFQQTESFPAPGYACGSGYACAVYAGPVRQAILGWKDHGDEEVGAQLARAIARLAVSLRPLYERVSLPDLVIVPAPSSAASMRRRGRAHLRPLAQAVAHQLTAVGLPAQAQLALTMSAVKGKAVELHSSSARARRVSGHIQVKAGSQIAGRSVIVVDDIVTTGSTLRQCGAALSGAGARPILSLALARAGRHQASTDLL